MGGARIVHWYEPNHHPLVAQDHSYQHRLIDSQIDRARSSADDHSHKSNQICSVLTCVVF